MPQESRTQEILTSALELDELTAVKLALVVGGTVDPNDPVGEFTGSKER